MNASKYAYGFVKSRCIKDNILDKSILYEVDKAPLQDVVSILSNTIYREGLVIYSNKPIMLMLDYAITHSFSKVIEKLLLTPLPYSDKKLLQLILSRNVMENLKLLLEAHASNIEFEEIKDKLIFLNNFNEHVAKSIFETPTAEVINSFRILPFSISDDDISDLFNINIAYVRALYYNAMKINDIRLKKLLYNEIDRNNAILLIKSKISNIEINVDSIFKGNISKDKLIQIYRSGSLEELAEELGLADAYNAYLSSGWLTYFDLEMDKKLKDITKQFSSEVLTLGSIISIYYLKYFETRLLRLIIRSKEHGFNLDFSRWYNV